MSLRNTLIGTSAFAVAMCLASGLVQARQLELRSDKAVYFTFSQPIALPNVTLPAGRYLFRLADSLSNRSIVQVYSGDGAKMFGMMMTVPATRRTVTDDPRIEFMESAANSPVPVRSYWYAGSTQGWEFIYPRQQAMTLAKTATAPVLTTSRDVSADNMGSADIARVNASGESVDYNASSSQSAASSASQSGEIAAVTEPAANRPASATPTPVSQSASAATTRRELPQTAGSTATAGLIGVLVLSAAFALGLARRRSA